MFKTLKKMFEGGPNKSIEAVGFHYAKSMMHRFEMATGLETDPSDVVNEMINSTRKVGFKIQASVKSWRGILPAGNAGCAVGSLRTQLVSA